MELALKALFIYPRERRAQVARNCRRYWRDDLCRALLDRSYQERFSSPSEMRHYAALALAVSENLPPCAASADLRARAWVGLGRALKISGRLLDAEAAIARAAEEEPLGSGDPEIMACRMECLASLRLRQSRFPEAIDLYNKAAEIREGLGDWHGLAANLMATAVGIAELGKAQEALRLQTRANHLIDRRADPRLSLIGRHNGIQFILGMGRHHEAWKLMEASEPYYRAAGDDLILLQRRHLRGRIAREFGSRAMDQIAESELRGTAQDAIERGMPYLAAKSLLELAGFYADRGRHLLLPELIDEILPIFEALGVDRESLAARVLRSAAEDRAKAAVLLRTAAEHLAAVAGY